MADVYSELITKINKEQIYLNEPMKKHTTFKIGGKADVFVKVKTVEEARTCNSNSKRTKYSINSDRKWKQYASKRQRNKRDSCKTRFQRNRIYK